VVVGVQRPLKNYNWNRRWSIQKNQIPSEVTEKAGLEVFRLSGKNAQLGWKESEEFRGGTEGNVSMDTFERVRTTPAPQKPKKKTHTPRHRNTKKKKHPKTKQKQPPPQTTEHACRTTSSDARRPTALEAAAGNFASNSKEEGLIAEINPFENRRLKNKESSS